MFGQPELLVSNVASVQNVLGVSQDHTYNPNTTRRSLPNTTISHVPKVTNNPKHDAVVQSIKRKKEDKIEKKERRTEKEEER